MAFKVEVKYGMYTDHFAQHLQACTYCRNCKVEARSTTLFEMEKEWLREVLALPMASILDGGEGQKKCHELGQKIFNFYKNMWGGCTLGGKLGTQKIANAIVSTGTDGLKKIKGLRKQLVAYAWKGIGDEYWLWNFSPTTWIDDKNWDANY
jgi:hypothetical protein